MIHSISAIALLALLAGCVSSPARILKTSGPTMSELIDARSGGQRDDVESSIGYQQRQVDLAGQTGKQETLVPYTRTARNEIDQLFPLLPNPTITIYVYPHLSTRNRAPVPGYTTAVKMYLRDEYALPGERIVIGQ